MHQHEAHDALAETWRSVQQQGNALIVLKGPEGSGKSSVITTALRGAGREHFTVLNASRWEHHVPGATLLPLLPETQPEQLGPRLLELLRHQPQQARGLVIENAQWMDDASFQALHHAWRRVRDERVLIILVLRSEELPMLSLEARQFLDGEQAGVLELAAPTAAQARQITADAGIELPACAVEQLLRYTRGNLRALLELARENPERDWEETTPWPPAPQKLSRDIAQQLTGLDAQARAFIQAAAVLGRDAGLQKCARLAGATEPMEALEELIDQSLVHTQGHSGNLRLRFGSELARMAVYHQIPLGTRVALHAAAAQIVEDEGAALGHRADAQLVPEAQLSGQLAAYAGAQGRAGEWASASTAYFRALALCPDAPEREHLLLRAVDAIVAAGELTRAKSFTHQLSSLAASAERDVLCGYIAILQGRANTAGRWLSSARQLAEANGSASAKAVVSQRWVLHSLCQLKGQKLIDWAEESLSLAQPGSSLAIESAAIQGLGLAMMGRTAQGEALLKELLGTLPTGAQRQRAEMSLGWVYLATDRIELARHELNIASSVDFSEGSLRIALWAKAWLARAEFLMGDWDQALETARSALSMQERSEIQMLRPLIELTAVQIHAQRGHWDQAEAHLADAWSRIGSYPVMEVPYRMARAEVARARANYEEVVRALEPLLDLDRGQGIDQPGFWTWQDTYAAALIRSERVDEAEAFIRPLLEQALAEGNQGASARYLGVQGMVLAARGEIDAAREAFEQALARLEGVGALYHRAKIDFAYGQCLRRAGKRADCAAPLNRALGIFQHLGATVYVERCHRELQASGIGLSRREVGDWSTLTPQEQAVAKLVCAGASNRRVAEELFIGTKTVQYHLTKIYAKLCVSSRTELAALSRQDFEG